MTLRRYHLQVVLLVAGACRPFPATPCDATHPCPDRLQCDLQRQVCLDPPLQLVELRAPVTEVHPGESAVPLYARLRNNTDRVLPVVGLAPIVDPPSAIRWRPLAPLPLPLPAQTEAEIGIVLGLAADAAAGALRVNALAMADDPQRQRVLEAGPALAPVTLTIAPGPPFDADGDGLSDAIEQALGLAATDADSDSDTVDDQAEMVSDMPYDSDGDGLIDAADDDADNGGEPDLLEVRRGSDPRAAEDDRRFAELVVTTAADELEGDDLALADPEQAGVELSLREALTIAANRPGPDRITVAAALRAEPTPLAIDSSRARDGVALPPVSDADTFIDGSGLRIAWESNKNEALLRVTGPRFTARDVVVDATQRPPYTGLDSSVFQIAGDLAALVDISFVTFHRQPDNNVRAVTADGVAADALLYKLRLVEQADGLALTDGVGGSGRRFVLRRSVFEVDHASIWIQNGRDWLIEDNLLHGGYDNFVLGNDNCVVRRNIIGPSGSNGIRVQVDSQLIENNLIHDSAQAGILLSRSDGLAISGVTLRRNLIRASAGPAIAFANAASQGGIEPPAIAEVAADHVSGGHALDGAVIDLFATEVDEAEVYLGSVPVAAGQWRLDVALPAGRFIAATATDGAGNTSLLNVSTQAVPP